MRFAAVDIGEVFPTSTALRTALRTPYMNEKSQCVLLHLALALEWMDQGCPKRAPNKTRAIQLSTQLRAGDYQQALRCLEQIGKPKTTNRHEIWDAAHDAAMPRSGRNFQTMNCFSREMWRYILVCSSVSSISYRKTQPGGMAKWMRMNSRTEAHR